MTPKEKAEQLVFKFRQLPPSSPYTGVGDGEAKQCALIAVDEILKIVPSVYVTKDEEIHNGHSQYWLEVKQEILAL